MITLVLGGARSGKSVVAERLAARRAGPVTYVATAAVDPADGDHLERIRRHQARRDPGWTTVEATGGHAVDVLGSIEGTVLLDSLGTWLTGHVEIAASLPALCAALSGRSGDTIVVSEEVGLGVHPSSDVGRRFRDALGAVNLAVAEVADEMLLVVAGRVLPLERP